MRIRSLTAQQYARSAELLPEEPSTRNYWLDKGFVDLGATIRESFMGDRVAMSDLSGRMGLVWASDKFLLMKLVYTIFYLFGILSILVFGTLVTVVLSFVHSLVILVVMTIVYVLLGIAKALDGAYRTILHVTYACDRCKNIYLQPGYVCPSCGKVHSYLRPNTFGIFFHRCTCGQLMPATFFSTVKDPSGKRIRRSTLEQRCPNPACARQVSTGDARTLSVSVVGSRSVGKTTYIAALSHLLLDEFPESRGYETEFLDAEKQKLFQELEDCYRSGSTEMTREATDLNRPSAFSLSFLVKKRGLSPQRLLHVYDVAGETFLKGEEHETQLQYAYATGAIFLVDPMSIPEVSDELSERLSSADSAVTAREYPDTVLSNFVEKIRQVSGVGQGEQISLPLAVVLSKADLPGLAPYFDERARKAYLQANPACPDYDVDDALARAFLERHGMGNFLNMLQGNFKAQRLFVVSAIGHERLAGSFAPVHVDEPFSWILARSDRALTRALGFGGGLVDHAGAAPFAIDPRREKRNAAERQAQERRDEAERRAQEREAEKNARESGEE